MRTAELFDGRLIEYMKQLRKTCLRLMLHPLSRRRPCFVSGMGDACTRPAFQLPEFPAQLPTIPGAGSSGPTSGRTSGCSLLLFGKFRNLLRNFRIFKNMRNFRPPIGTSGATVTDLSCPNAPTIYTPCMPPFWVEFARVEFVKSPWRCKHSHIVKFR